MKKTLQIAPSILSADFLNLERDVAHLLGASPAPEWLHLDVMDGHFVPNLTIGPPFVRALKRMTDIPLDVHLMIDNPAEQVDWYLDAGADLLSIHVECGAGVSGAGVSGVGAGGMEKRPVADVQRLAPGTSVSIQSLSEEGIEYLHKLLLRIRAGGALAGISLNPNTPIETLEALYGFFDVVLVMSVHPGFGGQDFIKDSLDKIATLAKVQREPAANKSDSAFLIEVDGGINSATAPLVAQAGVDILVAGNAIFAQQDSVVALAGIREACSK